MSETKTVRIANGQGFWGDSILGPIRLVEEGPLDYLTLDYLAEVTMSIMQKLKNRDPEKGYATDFVSLLDRILPTNDGEVSKQFQHILKKQGFEFRLSTKVTGAKKSKTGVTLTVEPAAGGEAETIKADVVLLSIGRTPYTEGLGLDAVGVETDARGAIQVDAHFQTNVPGT